MPTGVMVSRRKRPSPSCRVFTSGRKLVTYPRTDSRYITTDIVPTLPARLKSIATGPYAALARPLLGKPLTPSKRFVDDSKVCDHHAIIPTEEPLAAKLATLSADERNLYDLIARRFIAVLYPPYRYDQTTIVTVVNGERFHSVGKVEKDPGWRAVTSRAVEKEEQEEDALPEQALVQARKGDRKQVAACQVLAAKTKPPARYNEATLLTAMESPGKFIEDEELREVNQGERSRDPGDAGGDHRKDPARRLCRAAGQGTSAHRQGRQLIKLAAPTLKTPELTAQWEQRLTDIAKGRDSRADFMAGIRENAAELVKSVIADTTVYKPDNVTRTKCPACGKFMLLVQGKRGKMLSCPDRACGHRQPERPDEGGFRSSKHESRINQRLISQFSDKAAVGTNLGELLKKALEGEDEGNKGPRC